MSDNENQARRDLECLQRWAREDYDALNRLLAAAEERGRAARQAEIVAWLRIVNVTPPPNFIGPSFGELTKATRDALADAIERGECEEK